MDLRTERTKRSIYNAFIELRTHKPLEKITVKELSELACINKATFYSHYHDIYDLTEQLENEILSSMLKGIPHPDKLVTNPTQAIEELALALTAQTSLLTRLFADSRSGVFAQKLEALLKEQIFSQYPEYQNNLKWDLVLSFIIQGCFHSFMSHSNGNIQETLQILGELNECLKRYYLPTLE